jgi:ribonuclease HI
VGKLFSEYRIFKESSFKSTLSVVDRSLQYLGYFDGCSKNNPGPSGVGYHIDHPVARTTLISRSEFIGIKRTNNQAELIALNLLLADAYCNDIASLTVFGDSELAIKFMRG